VAEGLPVTFTQRDTRVRTVRRARKLVSLGHDAKAMPLKEATELRTRIYLSGCSAWK
jgi:hypothetical protein